MKWTELNESTKFIKQHKLFKYLTALSIIVISFDLLRKSLSLVY